MKEKIRRAINRWHKPYNKTGMPDWADGAAAEIAKQVVSRDEYEAETAILGNRVFKAEARLAVMREALGLALIPMVSEKKKLSVKLAEYYLSSSLDWWQEKELSQLETRKAALADAQDAVMNALSTAPDVVWSGLGTVEQPTLGATRVRLDAKMDTWTQGEEYIVTVRRKPDGTDREGD